MVPYEIEIITAIAFILIGIILTIYLSILKKNGWIGKTSNYRCPNPQCKNVFQQPIKVKDYSNKKEIHLACPKCGYDLGSSNNKNALKENMVENKSELKTQELPPKLIENKVSMTNSLIKEPEIINANHPAMDINHDNSSQKTTLGSLKEISIESSQELNKGLATEPIGSMVVSTKVTTEEVKPLENPIQIIELKRNLRSPKTNDKLIRKKIEDDKKIDRPAGCNHQFGYLGSLPNGEKTPDECYSCSKLIDCFK